MVVGPPRMVKDAVIENNTVVFDALQESTGDNILMFARIL